MDFIKTLGRYYKDKDLFQQRKAEYSLSIVLLLFLTTLVLMVSKIIIDELIWIEVYIALANLVVFLLVFFIIYFGKLHFGVNLLCLLGLVRLFMVFNMYSVMQIFMFIPLLIIAVAFMYTKKYQYHIVNLFVLGVSMYHTIIGFIKYYNEGLPYEEAVLGLISFLYALSIIFILNRVIKIVELQINQSRKLFDLSAQDHLTKTFNRRKIDRSFKTNIFSKRISVLLIDFDDFKKVNDNYGHHIGDEVLSTSIELINTQIRKDDYVVRWGGEEFVVILHECDLDQAYNIAESLRKQIAENHFTFNENIKITVSIGVAYKEEKESIYETINRADKALYKAKDNGKNQTKSF